MTTEVKNQYENYPYPPRNPEDEKKRLIRTTFGKLERIGIKPERVLDAGCGTGDTAIDLAEQGIEVIALDFSAPSIQIAKERARIRGLKIRFICDSIFNIPKLNLGKFDYIVASGVLHHLDSDKGLKVLRDCLKPDGVIGIMVYGLYGRTAIYMVQKLMKIINENEKTEIKIRNTKVVLNRIPSNHWLNFNINWKKEAETDAGLYDLFLHKQDKPFTIPEIYAWLKRCGMKMIHLHHEEIYRPESYGFNKMDLPIQDQQAVAELVNGRMYKHSFWARCL